MGDVLDLAYLFSDRFDIHGSRNIDPAMTNENTQFPHINP
jgi:hypothetical protein